MSVQTLEIAATAALAAGCAALAWAARLFVRLAIPDAVRDLTGQTARRRREAALRGASRQSPDSFAITGRTDGTAELTTRTLEAGQDPAADTQLLYGGRIRIITDVMVVHTKEKI